MTAHNPAAPIVVTARNDVLPHIDTDRDHLRRHLYQSTPYFHSLDDVDRVLAMRDHFPNGNDYMEMLSETLTAGAPGLMLGVPQLLNAFDTVERHRYPRRDVAPGLGAAAEAYASAAAVIHDEFVGWREAGLTSSPAERSRPDRATYTTSEMQARIDDTLADIDANTDHGWDNGPAEEFADAINAAGTVDRPLAFTEHERAICRTAWEQLTGDAELPDWFDELVTVGEMARRAGVERTVVEAALDAARPATVWEVSHNLTSTVWTISTDDVVNLVPDPPPVAMVQIVEEFTNATDLVDAFSSLSARASMSMPSSGEMRCGPDCYVAMYQSRDFDLLRMTGALWEAGQRLVGYDLLVDFELDGIWFRPSDMDSSAVRRWLDEVTS